MKQLFIPPPAMYFGGHQQPLLARALEELVKYTLVTDIADAAELKLDRDGFLPDGYRYTTGCFNQVCKLACDGLQKLVCDVAGVHRPPSDAHEEYSFAEAVRVFNRLIELRCAVRFEDRQRLLRNVRTKTVDGVLGPQYTLISNHDIFERAREAAAEDASPYVFDHAFLRGRLLLLRYRKAAPLFSLPLPAGVEAAAGDQDEFSAGLHFANSEISGESSMRAAPLLVRAWDTTASLGFYFGGRRRPHIGKALLGLVGRMFSEAAHYKHDAQALRLQMRALQQQELALAGLAEAKREAAIAALKARLHVAGMPLMAAGRAVQDALWRGAYGSVDVIPELFPGAQAPARTAFDLYVGLTTVGKDLYATDQETCEHVAHKLLIKRFVAK